MRTLLLVVAIAVGACTSGKTDTDVVDTDVVDTDVIDSDTTVVDTEVVDCTTEETLPACRDCCVSEFPTSQQQLTSLIGTSCACAAEAPCAEECTEAGHDLCSGGTPSTACTECLDATLDAGSDACVSTAIAACHDDPVCEPLYTCTVGCGEG
jgi:hypothetical protein